LRKILSFFIIGALVLSMGTLVNADERKTTILETEKIVISNLIVEDEGEFLEIKIDETNSLLLNSNKPIIPYYEKTFSYPAGTIIEDIDVQLKENVKTDINKKITPSPQPQIASMAHIKQTKTISEELTEPYPDKTFDYTVGRGIKDEKPTTFVTVSVYPVKYLPNEKQISSFNEFEIKISINKPKKPVENANNYDLLILSPGKYLPDLNSLVTHKNNMGISTKLVVLDEIYNEAYFPSEGRDDIEEIKYFIKNAYDSWGIKNVLIVGGIKDFPARKTHIKVSEDDQEIFVSDLYYADLYDGSNNFVSWDSNENDVFAEKNWEGNNDEIDFYPDVRIGRLACTDSFEVETSVQKIINYETSEAWTKNWFNDIVVIGGDTIPASYGDESGIDEGELVNQEIIDVMDGFVPNRIWDSNNRLSSFSPTGVKNINDGINNGCGFVDWSGHGAPWVWTTFPHNGNRQSLPTPSGSYKNNDILNLINGEKLPIAVNGGCSLGKYQSDDDCFAWSYVSNPNGGGIASFGATGLGYIYLGEYVTYGLIEGLTITMFEEYSNGAFTVGEMLTDAYNDYISSEMDVGDFKTLTEWHLFGDPTLQIRGESTPPLKPTEFDGEVSGEVKKEYTYTARTTDPNGDDIYYLFDWGDGTFSDWLGPYASGEEVETTNSWDDKGEFAVRVKAKDTYGVQGEWSEPLTVSMPKQKSYDNSFFLRMLDLLQRFFPELSKIIF